MILIVGSLAAKHWGINRREPNDKDLWITQEDEIKYLTNTKVDYHVIPKSILESIPREKLVATPDALYTIKCSHFQWDIHWEKTKADILYMESKGCKLLPDLYERLMSLHRQERDDEYEVYTSTLRKSIDYQHLEQEGGGEGQGEYCYGVFKLKGVIYKASYSYYSYNGHEYNGICNTLQEVRPVEKTVIVYE